jgi:hypothetical protein
MAIPARGLYVYVRVSLLLFCPVQEPSFDKLNPDHGILSKGLFLLQILNQRVRHALCVADKEKLT